MKLKYTPADVQRCARAIEEVGDDVIKLSLRCIEQQGNKGLLLIPLPGLILDRTRAPASINPATEREQHGDHGDDAL